MKLKVLMILSTVIIAWAATAFASDLEIVEQDKPPVSIQEPAEAVGQPQDVRREATIIRAEDETGLETTEAGQAKVMPLPPEVQKEIGEPTRYTLGPDDVIEIIVRRHPEFSGQYPINAEGKIQYKFVGDIEIKDMTKTEVKEKIANILSKFIVSPDVEVTILEYRSKVIYVIGEVGAPGKYYMKADQVSVREAVVQAGLPQLTAAMRRTELIRPDKSGKPMTKKIDLYALLYEGKLELDEYMFNGDVLVIPATVMAKIMRVLNPITAPVGNAETLRRVGTGGF